MSRAGCVEGRVTMAGIAGGQAGTELPQIVRSRAGEEREAGGWRHRHACAHAHTLIHLHMHAQTQAHARLHTLRCGQWTHMPHTLTCMNKHTCTHMHKYAPTCMRSDARTHTLIHTSSHTLTCSCTHTVHTQTRCMHPHHTYVLTPPSHMGMCTRRTQARAR